MNPRVIVALGIASLLLVPFASADGPAITVQSNVFIQWDFSASGVPYVWTPGTYGACYVGPSSSNCTGIVTGSTCVGCQGGLGSSGGVGGGSILPGIGSSNNGPGPVSLPQIPPVLFLIAVAVIVFFAVFKVGPEKGERYRQKERW